MKSTAKLFASKIIFFSVIVLCFAVTFSTNLSAAGTPTILSFQGRLADASGNLLGSSGTDYYFKFSIWSSPTVGGGVKLWPTTNPQAATSTVRQGVFNVNIGDTAAGYPDALDYNFNTASDIYLQIEVSSDNVTYQTLSPRQRITASAFARLSGAVSGADTPSSFGTTTPNAGTQVTIEATSTNSILLALRARVGQIANLFQVQNSTGSNLFSVNANGGIFGASTLDIAGTSTFATTTASQLSVTGTTNLNGVTNVAGSVLPVSDGIHSLGSNSSRFLNLFAQNIFASSSIITSGTSTNYFATNFSGVSSLITNATSTNLHVSSFTGAGLTTSCADPTGKLLWDATTGTFSCGTDAGAGSGISTLNGLSSAGQTFAAVATTTGTDFSITNNGSSIHFFNIPDAGLFARGFVSTSSQTFAGIKTFADLLATNASSTNLFATTLRAINATINNITGGAITATSSLTSNGTLNVTGQTTLGNASTTGLTSSGTLNVTGQTTLGDASTTNLTVSGKTVLGAASTTVLTSTDLFSTNSTSTNFFTSLLNATTGFFTNLTATNATSTNFFANVVNGVTSTINTLTGGNITATSSLTSNGTLNVTGQTTLGNASTTGLTSSGTLNVSGQTTLGNASSTALTVSGSTVVSGTTTLATTSASQLTVSGQTTLGNASTTGLTSGNLNVAGQTTLGNASSSALTATTLYAPTIATNVAPSTDTTFSLGTNALRFLNLFAQNIFASSSVITSGTSTNYFATNFFGTNGTFNTALTSNGTLNVTGQTTLGNASSSALTVSGRTVLGIASTTDLTTTGYHVVTGTSTLATTTATQLTVSGQTTLGNASTSALTVSGKTVLGDASTTNVTVSGTLYAPVISGVNSLSVTNATTTNNFAATNASTTNATSTNFFTSLLNATTGFFTNLTTVNATSTNLFATALNAVTSTINTLTSGNITATSSLTSNGTLNVTGQTTLGNASTSALTANSFYSTFGNITNASTSALTLTGSFYDSLASAGTRGMVLQTTGTSTLWVATSSLGITSGSGVTGGINGFLARFTSPTTLSTGLIRDDGTVSGVNATSSTTTFNVQASPAVNPFNVASSSGSSVFLIDTTGKATFGNASTTGITSSGTLNVVGKTVLGVASTTDLTTTGYHVVTGTSTLATTTATALRASSFSGAGLVTSCADPAGKLLWDATTGTFSCGTDAGAGSGISSLNGLVAASQTLVAVATTTGTDFSITNDGSSIHQFNLPNASLTARGLVSTTSQSFAGVKTFTDIITTNATSTNFFTTLLNAVTAAFTTLNVTGQTTLATASSTALTVSGQTYLGNASSTAGITAATFYGAGTGLTGTASGLTAGNITGQGTLATLNAAPAGTLTGTTLNPTVVTSSLTSVGTLGSLTVSGQTSLGNASTTGLTVSGSTVITGTSTLATTTATQLTVSGQTTLGNASTTGLTVTGTTFNAGDIFPTTDVARSIGSNAFRFLNLFAQNIFATSSVITNATSSTSFATNFFGTNGTFNTALTSNGTLNVTGQTTLGNASSSALTVSGPVALGSTLNVTGQTTLGNASSSALTVTGSGVVLGTSTLATTTATLLTVSGQTNLANASTTNLTVNGTAFHIGDILPTTDVARSIGSNAFRFLNLFTQNIFATSSVITNATSSTSFATNFFGTNGTFNTALTSNGTLNVTGQTTLGNASSTALTVSGPTVLGSTLNVTGKTTITTASTTDLTTTGYHVVTGTSTLATTTATQLTVSGQTTLGNASTTGLTVTGTTFNAGDILPTTDVARSIGSNAFRFLNLFAQNIFATSSVITNATSTTSFATNFFGTNGTFNTALTSNGTLNVTGQTTLGNASSSALTVSGRTVLGVASTTDLTTTGFHVVTGTSTLATTTATQLTVSGQTTLGNASTTGLTVTGTTFNAGDILPTTDIARSIGTNALRFLNLFAQNIFATSSVITNATSSTSFATNFFGTNGTFNTALTSNGTLNVTGQTTLGNASSTALTVSGPTVLGNTLNVTGKTTLTTASTTDLTTTGYHVVTGTSTLATTTATALRATSFSGAGLVTSCTDPTGKLLWDATTGTFSCGVDSTGAGGGITSLNGLTGSTQTLVTQATTTGTDFSIFSSGTSHTFAIPDAGVLARGFVSTTTQSFAGVKTFTDIISTNATSTNIFATALNAITSTINSFTGGSITATSSLTSNGTLNVTGQTTLGNASTTGLTVSGPAVLGSTLNVTGQTTLGNASSSALTVSGRTVLGIASTTDLTTTGYHVVTGTSTLATTTATLLTVSGQTNLATASTTGLTVTGTTFNAGDILPTTDATRSIGTNTLRFLNLFAQNIFASSSVITSGTSTNYFSTNFFGTNGTFNTALTSNGTLNVTGQTTLGNASSSALTVSGRTVLGVASTTDLTTTGYHVVTGTSTLATTTATQLTVSGQTTLGNASTTGLTVTGTTFNAGDIFPTTDVARSIGSNAFRFLNLFAQNIFATSSVITNATSSTSFATNFFGTNGTFNTALISNGTLAVTGQTTLGNASSSALTVSGRTVLGIASTTDLTTTGYHVVTGTSTLATTTATLLTVSGQTNLANASTTGLTVTGTTFNAGDILPTTDVARSIGSNAFRFLNLFTQNIFATSSGITNATSSTSFATNFFGTNGTFNTALISNGTLAVTGQTTLGNASSSALTVSGRTVLGIASTTDLTTTGYHVVTGTSTLATTTATALRATSFSGAGLVTSCTDPTGKLLWDATTGTFSCGVDSTGAPGGGITSLNGLTGAAQTLVTQATTTGTDFSIFSSGTSHTFAIPDAGVLARGFVSTTTQSFAGVKTFTGALNASSTLVVTGQTTFFANTNHSGDILPTTDIARSIGTNALRFLNLFAQNIFASSSVITNASSTVLTLGTGSSAAGSLFFANSANNFTTQLVSSSTQTGNLTFTLPGTLGSAGQVLTADGSGGLYFTTASATGGASLSTLTAATTVNNLANQNFAQNWNWGTLTTQTAMTFSGGTAMTTGTIFTLGSTTTAFTHTTAETGQVQNIIFTDNSTNASGNSVTDGLNIASTLNTSGAGTKDVEAINIAAPTLTGCATGACNWDGIEINTQTTGASATIKQNGLNIVAAGIASGALNGILIGAITPGAGTENAINIGGGYDTAINYAPTAVTVSSVSTATGLNFDLTNVVATGLSSVIGRFVSPGDTNIASATKTGLSISSGTIVENTAAATGVYNGINLALPSVTTTTGTSVTDNGLLITTPSQTQTTALTTNYNGIILTTPGALVQNTAAGTINWNGVSLASPAITGTTGTVTASGLSTTNGSITTTGTQNGISITTGSIATAGTQNGIKITAAGIGAGTLNGVTISNITAGAGIETGLFIGSGWDTSVLGAGALTFQSGPVTNLSLLAGGSTTTDRIQIGAGGTLSATPDLLVLDTKNTTGDPSGTNGAMYYNATTTSNMCFANGIWGNCSGWQFLGTATGATVTVGPVVWTGTYRQLMVVYSITGYSGGTPVGRLLMGAASISTTATTNGTTLTDQGPAAASPTSVSAPSIPGMPLASVVGATGDIRFGYVMIDGASGAAKTLRASGGNTGSVTTPPKIFNAAGVFNDASTNLPIQRMQLSVYDAITGTTISTNSFSTGTYFAVYGRNNN